METALYISLLIAVIAITINFLVPILEILKIGWRDRKTIIEWTWEKKLSWAYVIINPTYSYFINKESPWLVLFFHLMWILVINVIMDLYLKRFEYDPSDKENKKYDKTQKERTVFIVIAIIFSIEILTQIFYNHSIVNVIGVILPKSADYEDINI